MGTFGRDIPTVELYIMPRKMRGSASNVHGQFRWFCQAKPLTSNKSNVAMNTVGTKETKTTEGMVT